ncbi:stage III sporulation protein AA, partial [Bacillus sp. D-CC]
FFNIPIGMRAWFVELSKARGPGTVMQVKDKNGKSVLPHRKAEGVW